MVYHEVHLVLLFDSLEERKRKLPMFGCLLEKGQEESFLAEKKAKRAL